MQLARPARGAITSTDDDPGDLPATGIVPDDAALVEAAQRDIAAFAPLYERHVNAIHLYCLLYCLRRLGSRDDAADATALTFTRAIASIRKFRPNPSKPGSTFRAWLFTIARNVVLDRYRRTRPHLSLDTPDADWHIADRRPGPEDHAIHADDARTVAALLRHLPDRQRAVVELRLAGLATAEIAAALDLTEPAAKSLQIRAYRTLRDLVATDPALLTTEPHR